MKNLRLLFQSQPVVVVVLCAGIVLATGTAIVATLSARDIASFGSRASLASDALVEISGLHTSLTDAATAHHTVLATGSASHQAAYRHAVIRLNNHVAQLRRSFTHSPAQLAALAQVSRLIAEWDRSLAPRTAAPGGAMSELSAAAAVANGAEGATGMAMLREALLNLEQKEFAALAESSAVASERADVSHGLLLGVSVACVFGIAGALFLVRRTQEDETLITVCAWTKRVRFNNDWVNFEDYLRDRFNLQLTHGICEEAAEKLRQEVVELTSPNSFKFPEPSDSTSPIADISIHPASIRAA